MCLLQRESRLSRIHGVERRINDGQQQNTSSTRLASSIKHQGSSVIPRPVQLLSSVRQKLLPNRNAAHGIIKERERLYLVNGHRRCFPKTERCTDQGARTHTTEPRERIYRYN